MPAATRRRPRCCTKASPRSLTGCRNSKRCLGVKALEVVGRKAHLTPSGEVLYRRAKALLEEAGALESAAGHLAAGWESELRLAVEIIFPTWLLLQCFARFGEEQPQTRIELYESVLSGTEEALLQRRVDLAICSRVPQGFAGDPLMRLRFVAHGTPAASAAPARARADAAGSAPAPPSDHPRYRQPATQRQLGRRRAKLDRESQGHVDPRRQHGPGICLVSGGYRARGTANATNSSPCRLREGGERWGELYLVFADRDYAGPGALRLAQIIREQGGGTVPPTSEARTTTVAAGPR